MKDRAPPVALTPSLEDYLETIYDVIREKKVARVRDVTRRRNVASSSVTPALRRLEEKGLIEYVRRDYISLTPRGEEEARRVFSRHRILSDFFSRVLDMPEEQADIDACAMEHYLSDHAMDRLVRFFEYLRTYPRQTRPFLARFHESLEEKAVTQNGRSAASTVKQGRGGTEGQRGSRKTMTLMDLPLSAEAHVIGVTARGAIRRRLLDMGVLPDALIRLERVAPSGDPVWIQLGGYQIELRKSEAESISIKPA